MLITDHISMFVRNPLIGGNIDELGTRFPSMRTPLNAVIGFAGLGEMAEDASQKDEYFSKIKASGKLLNSLIDDTLTLSKISSGKLVLNLEPTRPSELFNVIVDLTEHEAKAKGIIFTADMSNTP